MNKQETIDQIEMLIKADNYTDEQQIALDIACRCVNQHDWLVEQMNRLTAELAAEKQRAQEYAAHAAKAQDVLTKDAAELAAKAQRIENLEQLLAAVTSERDAAICDLNRISPCATCKKYPCSITIRIIGQGCNNYEWDDPTAENRPKETPAPSAHWEPDPLMPMGPLYYCSECGKPNDTQEAVCPHCHRPIKGITI
jgi:hypothetical protein